MGTYGSATLAFRGYSASQDCSVGYWSDHEAEADAFRSRQKQAKKALAELQPLFQRIYDRFAGGEHGWRRHLARLDRDRTRERQDDYRIRFVLPPFQDRPVDGRISIHLYLKRDVAPVNRELALAGFLLSQAAHFRDLFRVDSVGQSFEEILRGWSWTETCLGFPRAIEKAVCDEDALRRDPSPQAALVRAALDGTPIPEDVIATADPGLLIRFASDAQWPRILARVREAMVDLDRRDSSVREWWTPLLAADPASGGR
jgi:hypothetical protein